MLPFLFFHSGQFCSLTESHSSSQSFKISLLIQPLALCPSTPTSMEPLLLLHSKLTDFSFLNNTIVYLMPVPFSSFNIFNCYFFSVQCAYSMNLKVNCRLLKISTNFNTLCMTLSIVLQLIGTQTLLNEPSFSNWKKSYSRKMNTFGASTKEQNNLQCVYFLKSITCLQQKLCLKCDQFTDENNLVIFMYLKLISPVQSHTYLFLGVHSFAFIFKINFIEVLSI